MTIDPAAGVGPARVASVDAQLKDVKPGAHAADTPLPYQDSRRLTGPNLYFAVAGAVLETASEFDVTEHLVAAWREHVEIALIALAWPCERLVAHRHATGAAFAFSAPIDQLYTATEVNEWAYCASLAASPRDAVGAASSENWYYAPGHAAIWDQTSALYTLRKLAAHEQHPQLIALIHEARARVLPILLDDELLTLGEGSGSRSWPLAALPALAEVDWSELHAIPVVLVTGSNGKTTTTRLLAAMLAAQGLSCGYSSTDGVFGAGVTLESGDFSGPMGARAVLRDRHVEVAVLETARGGILRRGLAVEHAQAAIVTNISADHFGEYGIHDLDGLADAKLVVARALQADGVLVLNADDAVLVARASRLPQRIAWFAQDAQQPLLSKHRALGGTTCGARDGRLILHADGIDHDLGSIAQMPLTVGGSAGYNIANIAGAVLLAYALHLAVETLREVLRRFGHANADNPGRLMRWTLGGVRVLLDYAHNPEGLRGLLAVAATLRDGGRTGLVLGQAGNREDADIRRLAAAAAEFRPELIVLKDIRSFLRGREPGEIAALLHDELLRREIPTERIVTRLDEVEAARATLQWSRTGDVLVLPIHDSAARAEVVALLDELRATQWAPNAELPLRELRAASASPSVL